MKDKQDMTLLDVSLQTFDGSGAGGTAAGAGAAEGASTGSETQGNAHPNASQEVVYGLPPEGEASSEKAPDDPSGDSADKSGDNEPTPEELEKQFNDLINGQFKDQYRSRTESIVKDRLKNSKEAQTQLKAIAPIMELLQAKYGTDDIAKLAEVMNREELPDIAMKAGFDSPEMYRAFMETQRTVKNQQAEIDKFKRDEQYKRVRDKWDSEAEKLKTDHYPDFDLGKELQNPTFNRLLQHGFDMKSAYETANLDNLMNQRVDQVKKDVSDTLKSRKARPKENGSTSTKGATIRKTKASELTAADRKKIAELAKSGQTIRF